MKTQNNYVITHESKTITITKDFETRSSIIGSKEYSILSQLHKDFPQYTIRRRTAKVPTSKKTHNGLTLVLMEKHIEIRNDPLEEFERIKAYYKGSSAYYAKVKAWFLSKYKDYADYNIAA